MKYHNITKADMLNGEGLRTVLWVSGCSHHCPGCQNVITWDENDGVCYDHNTLLEIYHELDQDWCSGLTLSGGDPLFVKNRKDIRNLVINVKKLYPTKTIWVYTGYTYEKLIEQTNLDLNLKDILSKIDVLIDGKFILNLKDDKLHYIGSSNQRIIDMKRSLEIGEIVPYKEISKDVFFHRINCACEN